MYNSQSCIFCPFICSCQAAAGTRTSWWQVQRKCYFDLDLNSNCADEPQKSGCELLIAYCHCSRSSPAFLISLRAPKSHKMPYFLLHSCVPGFNGSMQPDLLEPVWQKHSSLSNIILCCVNFRRKWGGMQFFFTIVVLIWDLEEKREFKRSLSQLPC